MYSLKHRMVKSTNIRIIFIRTPFMDTSINNLLNHVTSETLHSTHRLTAKSPQLLSQKKKSCNNWGLSMVTDWQTSICFPRVTSPHVVTGWWCLLFSDGWEQWCELSIPILVSAIADDEDASLVKTWLSVSKMMSDLTDGSRYTSTVPRDGKIEENREIKWIQNNGSQNFLGANNTYCSV